MIIPVLGAEQSDVWTQGMNEFHYSSIILYFREMWNLIACFWVNSKKALNCSADIGNSDI